jgi:hypothetical protein
MRKRIELKMPRQRSAARRTLGQKKKRRRPVDQTRGLQEMAADAGGINPYAKKQMININNKPFLNNWL